MVLDNYIDVYSMLSGGADGRIHVYDLAPSSIEKHKRISPLASVQRSVGL